MARMDEKYLEELKQVFIESCEDRIHSAFSHLEKIANNEDDPEESLMVVRRDLHSLKGMGGSCGFPGITTISHRAEEYLCHTNKVSVKEVSDLYKFFDEIQSLLESEIQPSTDEIAEIIRKLPYYGDDDLDKIIKDQKDKKAIEALSIMPESVHQRLINNELRDLGFRVSNITSSTEAIDTALNTKPDFIVISAVIDEISGFELAKMLQIVEKTKNIPVILVTSFDKESLAEKDLPADVSIARKGEFFSEDISKCLMNLKIIQNA